MKPPLFRTLVAACLFSVSTFALPAQPFVLMGAGAGIMDQKTGTNEPWDAAAAGLEVQSYLDLTESFGMYTAAALGFVVASRSGGTALDVGQYQTMALDLLLGVGFRLPLDPFTGVLGGGIFFGSTTMTASDNSLVSFAAGGVGVGVGVSFLYPLSQNWGIGANVNAAYFFGIPSATAAMAPSGLGLFGGVGVAYVFRAAPLLGSGVTPF